jgi:menaquinone-dependent protoporphyrinogen oxidase
MKKILVTYASKYGSTREIAERVGQVLDQAGLQVDVLPVNNGQDLSAYQAVIVGSAIYIDKWPKEAVRFLQSHERELAARSVWLFSSGPTGEGNPVDLVEGKCLPAELKPVVDRIHPRDVTVFHGHINPARMNTIEKWAIKNLKKKPFGDFRDWNMIEEWAIFVAAAVMSAETSGALPSFPK